MYYGSKKRPNKGRKCEVCGHSATTRHHIVHRSKGGSNKHHNLQTLCHECHNKAHNVWRIPSGVRVDAESIRSAEVMYRRANHRKQKLESIRRIKEQWASA